MPKTKCPHCNWKGEVGEELIGQEAVCPECENTFLVKRLKKRPGKNPVPNKTKQSASVPKKSKLKVILGTAIPIIGIVVFFLSGYIWDNSLRSSGEAYIKNLRLDSAAEKDYVLWLGENLHNRARNKNTKKTGSKRSRAASGLFPSKSKYLSALKEMIESYLNDPDVINEYAWATLENGGNINFALEMGLKAKKLAEQKQLNDYGKAGIWDTLAFAYHKKGDKAQAVTFQTKALEFLRKAPEFSSEGQEFNNRLKKYQK